MGFWKSVVHKASKEHICIYCGKAIKIGEEYNRETGKTGGEFYDYCLCSRCRWVIDSIDIDHDGELGDFAETLWNYDLIACPSCGSSNLREYDFTDNIQKISCECDDCDEKWIADLSIDGLKHMAQLDS